MQKQKGTSDREEINEYNSDSFEKEEDDKETLKQKMDDEDNMKYINLLIYSI